MSSDRPTLDDLIRAQRHGVGLSDGQRARSRARLLARVLLGGAAGITASAGAAATLPATTTARVVASGWAARAAVSLLLAGSGAGYVAARLVSPPPTLTQARSSVPTAPLHPLAAVEQPSAREPTSADASAAASSSAYKQRLARANPSPAPTPSSSLAAAVQLMHDVETALHAGQAPRALALLDQHRGDGFMAEERAAARIVTLCQLGRVDAARSDAARFLRDRPRSPLAARVRGSCAKPAEQSEPEKAK